MPTTKKDKPRHTCDTALSGSERSENTCAACHAERPPCPDYMAMWLAQVRR